MTDRNTAACIALAALLLQAGCSTFAAPERETSDFTTFIDSLLLDDNASVSMLDWSWANEAGDRVA